jgi:hypothetical protein
VSEDLASSNLGNVVKLFCLCHYARLSFISHRTLILIQHTEMSCQVRLTLFSSSKAINDGDIIK